MGDDSGAAVVAAARRWIGTPYVHGASLRGVGTDCLGLIRGLWRELVGAEAEPIPAYGREWPLDAADERLLAGLTRRLVLRPAGEAREGDVLLIRMRRDGPAGHVGVRASDGDGRPTLIHAYSGRGVRESPLGHSWTRHVTAVFGFPVRS